MITSSKVSATWAFFGSVQWRGGRDWGYHDHLLQGSCHLSFLWFQSMERWLGLGLPWSPPLRFTSPGLSLVPLPVSGEVVRIRATGWGKRAAYYFSTADVLYYDYLLWGSHHLGCLWFWSVERWSGVRVVGWVIGEEGEGWLTYWCTPLRFITLAVFGSSQWRGSGVKQLEGEEWGEV